MRSTGLHYSSQLPVWPFQTHPHTQPPLSSLQQDFAFLGCSCSASFQGSFSPSEKAKSPFSVLTHTSASQLSGCCLPLLQAKEDPDMKLGKSDSPEKGITQKRACQETREGTFATRLRDAGSEVRERRAARQAIIT